MHGARALIAVGLSAAGIVVGVVHAAPVSTPAADQPVEAAFRRGARSGRDRGARPLDAVRDLRIEMVRVGPGGSHAPLGGRRVAPIATGAARTVRFRVGRWPTGLYAASLRDGRRHGWAVLVVRPRRLGAHRVAVVEPTNTWQAYNFRDVDGNGVGDTWYADPCYNGVDLTRPFLRHGVPPHFRDYDLGFLRWLARSGHRADFLSDDDLERLERRRGSRGSTTSSSSPATRSTWRRTPGTRSRGTATSAATSRSSRRTTSSTGSSAAARGSTGRAAGATSAAPRPRSLGATYVGWFENRYPNRPYVVTGAQRLRGSSAAPASRTATASAPTGSRSTSGQPARRRARSCSPRSQNVFGPGRSAEMTYYADAAGREGVLGRRDQLRRLGRVAGRLAAARQPLAGAQRALTSTSGVVSGRLTLSAILVASGGERGGRLSSRLTPLSVCTAGG